MIASLWTKPFVWARVGRLLVDDRVEAAAVDQLDLSTDQRDSGMCARQLLLPDDVYFQATNPLVVRSLLDDPMFK